MRIRVVRGVVVQGEAQDAGAVLEVSDSEARRLVAYGVAERVSEPFGGERVAVPEVEHRDPFPKGKKR